MVDILRRHDAEVSFDDVEKAYRNGYGKLTVRVCAKVFMRQMINEWREESE